jgi:hypothetical protein
MCFLGYPTRDDAPADRAAGAPQEIDLAADEWDEVEPASPPADEHRLGISMILSFWAIAAVLLLVIVAAPALEAAAHRLH